jgi:hypothetical protein
VSFDPAGQGTPGPDAVTCDACGFVGGPLVPSVRKLDWWVCADSQACFDRWYEQRPAQPPQGDGS